ncbi:GNAT family N-acetyltransferase [Rhizobium sp. CNPSo 3464]|uniref:GNAT family N-acetyltransferase n=1 Tax=Rhizobium sp. CNPSo 3464 TaxID=3021406 RepID=UPI00254B81B4|nr:GNAT family N-acetyltransferase [Rhizobium sp. CNPSo 3464]MDK4740329.1 GNAT family N-acetyltransferase [Rhizobium sp. CNPSo 3464]
MSDLLVRLYDLPAYDDAKVRAHGIEIRRALTPERSLVLGWIEKHFGLKWAAESETGFGSHPITTWIAVKDGEMLGFACGDAIAKGFFGPTGVAEDQRGKGVGEALLFAVLYGLREAGYAYAIIGDPGPVEFYRKRLDILEIPGSWPGIYRGMLRTSS